MCYYKTTISLLTLALQCTIKIFLLFATSRHNEALRLSGIIYSSPKRYFSLQNANTIRSSKMTKFLVLHEQKKRASFRSPTWVGKLISSSSNIFLFGIRHPNQITHETFFNVLRKMLNLRATYNKSKNRINLGQEKLHQAEQA